MNITVIHSAIGDLSNAKSNLDYCQDLLKNSITYSEDEIIFLVKKVVSICDKVASELEKEIIE